MVGYIIPQTPMLEASKSYSKGGRSISATSGSAALAAYNDWELLQEALKKTLESKEYLYKVFKKQRYDYLPSSTIFNRQARLAKILMFVSWREKNLTRRRKYFPQHRNLIAHLRLRLPGKLNGIIFLRRVT